MFDKLSVDSFAFLRSEEHRSGEEHSVGENDSK